MQEVSEMIVIKDVSKKLGERQVLQDISFHIRKGECVGIIGRNGAGKTTLLNMISGILKIDAGFLRVHFAEDTLKNFEVLRKMAYISAGKSQLWRDWKLMDSFENCGKMYRIPKEEFQERLVQLTEQLDMKDCLDKKVYELSLGQRMRGEIIYSLLPNPELLLLDEAMTGLDVSVKCKIMDLFQQLKEEKQSTMIFTSHNLTEIEKLCDRVILLEEGKILFDGSIEKIKKDFAPLYQLEAEVEGNFPDLEDLPVEKFSINGNIISIQFDKQKIETAELLKHITGKCRIKDARIKEPNLEDTIRKIHSTRQWQKASDVKPDT